MKALTPVYGVLPYELINPLFTDYSKKTRFVWMRIFSTYGPLDTGAWLIPQTVDSLSLGKSMDLTKGEQEWSYLHAYDLARAFGAVVDNPAVAGVDGHTQMNAVIRNQWSGVREAPETNVISAYGPLRNEKMALGFYLSGHPFNTHASPMGLTIGTGCARIA